MASSYGYIAGSTFQDPEIGFNVITPTSTIKYYNYTDTLCRGTTLQFVAFSNPLITSYSWSFGDGTKANGQSVSHNYPIAGTYKLNYYYQKKGVCGLDSIVWNIYIKCCNPLPGIQATTPVCAGNNSNITYTAANIAKATYTWDFNGGNVISGSGTGPYQVNWSLKGKDTVWVYVTEPTCKKDSANFVITVNPNPTVSVGGAMAELV